MVWTLIWSILAWLRRSEHVAHFQRYLGVLPINEQLLNEENFKLKKKNYQHHQRKVTYDTNVLDECIEEIRHSRTKSADVDYRIDSWPWYYFFQFGSSLGNEIFYIVFFPTWIWNVDSVVARQVAILWASFMYLGQASKDVLGIPRPQTPPVLKLEKRYIEEYGFPSTHAMFATGIPLSLVLLSHQRYEFPLWIGLLCALVVCLWVCLSRIYLGMHTFLDIIGGAIFAVLLVFAMVPFVSEIDDFILNFTYSPLMNFFLGIFLIKCYPSLKQWSTARSDTTVILGSTFGLLTANNLMNQLGFLEKSPTPPIYAITPPNFGLCFIRTLTGMLIIGATREIVKRLVLRLTCAVYGLNWKDPEIKRLGKVEMPYYYLTYFAIGFNISFLCPLVYRATGINRDYSYTEL